jgi:predicted ester cyclase
MIQTPESARNKAVIDQFPGLLRTPDPLAIRSLFTEDFQLHDVKYPNWPRGYEGAVRMFAQMKALMPDITADIEDMFGEGDKICVRWRFKGTVTGAFEGRNGDGSRFEGIVFSIYRFRDGRVAEDWGADIPLPAGHAWRTD